MDLFRATFDAQRDRRFGAFNPERMRLEFWEWMVLGHEGRPPGHDPAAPPSWSRPRWASSEGVRAHFGVGYEPSRDRPVWTFERWGSTRDTLPDGRVICVGGEYEDYYDPDFCIYNDVVVLGPDGSVAIYGYPKDVFPPTDFHTASLLGDRLILIGSIGYKGERLSGVTPVYALHLDDYRIEPLETRGEPPGWISKHEARIEWDTIVVSGGEVYFEEAGEGRFRRNLEDYALHVPSGTWRRASDRGWRQFWMAVEGVHWHNVLDPESITPEGVEGHNAYIGRPVLLPPDAVQPADILDDDDFWRGLRGLVEGVPVAVHEEMGGIVMVIEGRMDEARAVGLAERLRARIEAACGRPCVVRRGR